MALPIVDEQNVEALDLPGRMLRWVVTKENINAQNCSMCVIEVQPGQTVKPAHSHPHGEEVIYLLSGSGRVWIEGEIGDGSESAMLSATSIVAITLVCAG